MLLRSNNLHGSPIKCYANEVLTDKGTSFSVNTTSKNFVAYTPSEWEMTILIFIFLNCHRYLPEIAKIQIQQNKLNLKLSKI